MTQIRCLRLEDPCYHPPCVTQDDETHFDQWIEVDIDDFVQIAHDDHGHMNEFIEIERMIGTDESIQGNRSQIANRDLNEFNQSFRCTRLLNLYLIRCSVFDDFRAEIRAVDGSQMLLIALGVALIFVQHERCASFDLSIDDGEPQILSFDCTTAQSFLFVSTSKRETFQVERFMWNSLPRV